jgi:putative ATP-binding cassette transporter
MNVSEKKTDKNNNKENSPSFNLVVSKLFSFIQVYWYPKDAYSRAFSDVIRSWGMLLLLIFLLVALVSFNAFNSFVFKDLIDATESKDGSKLTELVIVYGLTLGSMTLLTGFSKFVRKLISLDWHQWINDKILNKYFKDRAYYQINFKGDIANPDQRLAQEIEPLARTTMDFLATCFEKIMEMTFFIIILWSISKTISIVLIFYTILGNALATYITQQLKVISKKQLEIEANYNYALTHVRNHAESIAFFRGEDKELNIIQRKFADVVQIIIKKIDWERNQELFSKGYQSVVQLFPFILVAPLYVSGQITELGEVNQASYSCFFFSTALSVLVDEFGKSGEFINYIERLENFSKALDSLSEQPKRISTIQVIEENYLGFDDFTLQTPDCAKVIVENLSISVEPGQGLLIVGPSGRGKSSLLRAISGLWNAGSGDLIRPPLDNILFLPQRPYIILGTLREQLIYPQTTNSISELELRSILQQVNLQDALERIKNFDEELPWENILSLGEQQRLAFARLLVNQPNFIILDEATSALDLRNEDNLYKQLQKMGKTFISVGHRESLFKYHQKVLELSEDSSWRLVDMEQYRATSSFAILDNINHQAETPAEIIIEAEEMIPEVATTTYLSHQEMQQLTSYTLSTVKNKGSRGQTITANDGFSYRYDKNPDILKWVRV